MNEMTIKLFVLSSGQTVITYTNDDNTLWSFPFLLSHNISQNGEIRSGIAPMCPVFKGNFEVDPSFIFCIGKADDVRSDIVDTYKKQVVQIRAQLSGIHMTDFPSNFTR